MPVKRSWPRVAALVAAVVVFILAAVSLSITQRPVEERVNAFRAAEQYRLEDMPEYNDPAMLTNIAESIAEHIADLQDKIDRENDRYRQVIDRRDELLAWGNE